MQKLRCDCKAGARTEGGGETYPECAALFASVRVQQRMDKDPGETDSDKDGQENESEHESPGGSGVIVARGCLWV